MHFIIVALKAVYVEYLADVLTRQSEVLRADVKLRSLQNYTQSDGRWTYTALAMTSYLQIHCDHIYGMPDKSTLVEKTNALYLTLTTVFVQLLIILSLLVPSNPVYKIQREAWGGLKWRKEDRGLQ